MKTETQSLSLGLLITLGISFWSYQYLQTRDNHTLKKKHAHSLWYNAAETLDLKYNDLKYKYREPRSSQAPVALLAVDDDSIREIGRWPWSRDLIVEMLENPLELGARNLGMDIIFSEPEKAHPENDQKLAEFAERRKNQLVLGVFSEDRSFHQAYQDYCVAEAFLKTGGEDIVKLNGSFVIDEEGDPILDALPWGDLFGALFEQVQNQTEVRVAQELELKGVEEFNSFQKNFLNSEKTKDLFRYCLTWLTPEDRFLKGPWRTQIEELYKNFVKQDPKLSAMDFESLRRRLANSAAPHPVPQYGEWTANISSVQKATDFSASFVTELDVDGYVRRYPLFYRSGNKLGSSYVPSLALQTYLNATGYRAEVKIKSDPKTKVRSLESFKIFDPSQDPEVLVGQVPVDSQGQLLVNYYGPQMSLPYIPAKELFTSKETMKIRVGAWNPDYKMRDVRQDVVSKKDFLKDKSLIVGATAVATYDLRSTPTEANYPGPEIHLTALANLFEQNFLRHPPKESQWWPLALFGGGIVLSAGFALLGSISASLLMLLSLLVFIAADFWLFLKHNYLVTGVFGVLLIFVSHGAITVFRFFTEERKKKELKSTFSKYVSPAIVDELLREPDKLKLGGRRQRMSVFFSDLRGFTTISEKLSPEDLVKLLNRYLSPMTEIVFKNKGTLDKYMGDAIMAFFGAPVASPDHAQQACRCALESLKKLKELQIEFEKEGLPHIDIGIGINTGEMNVGNMGSNIVQNYTVMGDSVNLASRLEGTNKEYGSKVIISEFTFEDVKNNFLAREIDRVRVKGKLDPVRIYELMAELPAPQEDTAKASAFDQAYRLYGEQKFTEALSGFKQIFLSSKDPVSEVFIVRCEEFLKSPPGDSWDGVYVMKTK